MKRVGIQGLSGPGVVTTAQAGAASIGAAVPNWWDPNNVGLSVIGAWQARNAASYAVSFTDLSGNGNNLVEIGGATPWAAATGWAFNAALLRCLDTQLLPATDQSWSLFVQYDNLGNVGASPSLAGMSWGADNFALQVRNLDVRYYNGNVVTVGPTLLTGNLAVVGNQGYRNGIAEGGAIGGFGGAGARTVLIGARNAAVPIQYLTAHVWAVALYDAGPAAVQAEALAIATAMAAL